MTEAQEKWLVALESGEFSQTHGWLQDEKGFCCLGVACKVAEKEGVQVTHQHDKVLHGGSLETQPFVQEWLGLRSVVGAPRGGVSLVSYNDSGVSFPEIAARVRANPGAYFVDPEPREVVEGPGVG